MYAEERQQAIASLVISKGRASVAELAETYDVTTETVRRDLAVLDRAGLVRRVHGGAVPVRALRLVEPGVGERENTRAEHKDAIAAAAAEFFPLSGASVLLDAGTTTSRIAATLPSDRELNVVTNSVPIAARLASMPSVSLQLLGGRVRGLTQAAVGEQVLRVLDTLRVDIAFIGTNGISVRHGLSTPDSDEAAVKRAMIASANYVVVVADSSKVGREDFVSFGSLSERRRAHHRLRTQRRLPRNSSPSRASKWSSHDRHRHTEPEPRPHRHACDTAHPRCGAPGQLGHHRTRRQGRQRRARPVSRRRGRRRAAARVGHRPHGGGPAGQRRARSAASPSPRRCGPTSQSPRWTAPQPRSTNPAPRWAPPPSMRSPVPSSAAPSTPHGW